MLAYEHEQTAIDQLKEYPYIQLMVTPTGEPNFWHSIYLSC